MHEGPSHATSPHHEAIIRFLLWWTPTLPRGTIPLAVPDNPHLHRRLPLVPDPRKRQHALATPPPPTYVAGPAPQRGHVDVASFTRVPTRLATNSCCHVSQRLPRVPLPFQCALGLRLSRWMREPIKSNICLWNFSYPLSQTNPRAVIRRHAPWLLYLEGQWHALLREWVLRVVELRLYFIGGVVFPNSTTEDGFLVKHVS